MVNVSKRKLDEEVFKKICDLFFEVVSRMDGKESFTILLNEFFSPKEKILLAKRIAIIYLLTKNIEQLAIAEILKVSPATVSKFNLIFRERQSKLIEILNSLVKRENIFQFIDDLIADLTIQPGFKLGHWKLHWEHEKEKARKKEYGL